MQPFDLLERTVSKRVIRLVQRRQRRPRTHTMVEERVVEIEEHCAQHAVTFCRRDVH
jgi:hypothetical protein